MHTLEGFLNLYGKPNTRSNYRASLRIFLAHVYGRELKTLSNEEAEELSRQYLQEQRDRFADLQSFARSLLEQGRAPKTVALRLAAVREWLAVNGWEPAPEEKRLLRKLLPPAKTVSEEDIATPEKLRRILQHLPLHGRALVLVLASSGMRLGEALSLHLEDVKLEEEPVRVVVRADSTKTGAGRVTFVSSEAAEALQAWLSRREVYLKGALNRNAGLQKAGRSSAKVLDDPRVFPFSKTVAHEMWHRALERAGFASRDRRTSLRKLRLHTLRKFFRSRLSTAAPVDVVEALMGHEGYLTGAYRRYTVEELAEYYAKAEHVLHIMPPENLVRAAHEVKRGLERNRALVEELVLENRELHRRLRALEEEVRLLAEFKDTLALMKVLMAKGEVAEALAQRRE
ncbi:MAG: site-specific integrase [Euryarchaeota archaeon]|nr:site-specific integrase [Euryarchaeota archaeon]